MATFIRRATRQQAAIYRIIAGAVRQAAAAHTENQISPLFAGQVAKRGAGTLAAMPAFAAASAAVKMGGSSLTYDPSASADRFLNRRTARTSVDSSRGAQQDALRSPLRRLHRRIGAAICDAKKAGNLEVAAALIEIARFVRQEIEKCDLPST